MGLKDIPAQFRIDSEEDLRAMIVSYCSELGFGRDEISCEDYFSITLGHTLVPIDKKSVGGRSDILISRNGKPLAIVETKAPNHVLTDEDAKQAISYARLLSTIAPFAIVTNGAETRVYDVIADGLVKVDNPQESLWSKNGQQFIGINDELKYEAAKLIIALNPETLNHFCEHQIVFGLSNLKSDARGNKKYNPDIYVERVSLNEAFADWLPSERQLFAVVAQSGYGKTNFMCAKTDEIKQSHFALFYAAGRFTAGLLNAIRNDFIWEFHRSQEIVHIFDRLNSLVQNSGKKLIIFIDAIDENPLGLKTIKNELLDIVSRISNYPNIKLVLSCKSFDWPYLVIDGAQSFNALAEAITPHLKQPDERIITPNAEHVGFHLKEFTDNELAEALTKYKSTYSIDGDFYGEIREESRNPLILRFIAETYGNEKEKLPVSISSRDLFSQYLNRKLEPIKYQNIGEVILSKIAALVFSSGIRSISKGEIINDARWNEGYESAFRDLIRLGVLSITCIDEQEMVGFEFNKFLLYFYVYRVKKLQTLSLENQVLQLKGLLQTPIGIEAAEFFLVSAEQKIVHKLLIELANHDLALFAQLITALRNIDTYEKSPIPIEHIDAYLEFYNFLRDRFFSELSYATMPYVKYPLGVIFIDSRPVKFRACTPTYPQPYVDLEDKELIQQLVRGPMDDRLYNDLMPVGTFYLGGNHDFAKYPQKMSYEHLLGEISSALSNRLLDETQTPDILQERVYAILLYEPSIWLQGDKLPHERYWKLLGFNSVEELGNAKVHEIFQRVNNLLNSFVPYLKKQDALYPSYFHRTNELFATLFTLSQLDSESLLGLPQYSLDTLLQYEDNVEACKNELTRLNPIVIKNYKTLFSTNFPSLIYSSEFFKNIEKLAIVELVNQGSYIPAFSYVVCPNIPEILSTEVITTSQKSSFTDKLRFKSLKGEGYSHDSYSGCGYVELNVEINDKHISDPEAFAIRTRFSFRTPILEQAYSLISHELRYLLRANHSEWKDINNSELANSAYLSLAAKSLLKRSGK